MGTARRVRTWALGLAAILGLGMLPGGAVLGQEPQTLLDEGLSKYREGDYEAAIAAFEKAFLQRPSSALLAEWLERAEVQHLLRMATTEKNERLRGAALAIIRGARAYIGSLNEDAEAIQAAVDAVLRATGEDRVRLMVDATNQFGRNLVPALVPLLGSSSSERQITAFGWIALRIGREAVPPLVAAWKHPDPRVRGNIARLLGASKVRSEYSLAYLQAMIETDEVEEVRAAAKESLDAILAQPVGESATLVSARKDMDAKSRFLRNAYLLFTKPHANEFESSVYTSNVYTLVGDRVIAERVARFQLSERMAEQNLIEALTLDPAYAAAHELLLLNDAAQVVEYDLQSKVYASQDSLDGEKELLATQQGRVDSILRPRTLAATSDTLYRALAHANKLRRGAVSQYLIERIRERKLGGAVPEALRDSLDHPESRLVRIAAAIAIAERNPQSFAQGREVVATLASAVLQSGVRTVIKAVGNSETSNVLQRLIESVGMESRFTLGTASEAYVTVKNLPPDLILVDEELVLDTQLAKGRAVEPVALFLNTVRNDYRTSTTPIIVAVAPSRVELARQTYESDSNRVWVMPTNISAAEFKSEYASRLFSDIDDEKSEGARVAADAANALLSIARCRNGSFPVEESIDTLRMALAHRPDDVRIPVIRALGAMAATTAVPDLATVYSNEDSATEVRRAAMESIAEIVSATRASIDESVRSIIVEGTRSSDLELRKAAWMAFADAGLDTTERLALYTSDASGGASLEDPFAEPSSEEGPFAESEDSDEDAGLFGDEEDSEDEELSPFE